MSDDVENDTVAAPEDAATEVVEKRSDVERQRDEYLDALQRLQADFENYRKRVARSPVARAAWVSMKSPALVTLKLITGRDRTAMHTLHRPLPQDTPIPV